MNTSHTVTGMPTPQTGDIWQEQDPRQPRFVKVDGVWPESVFIYAVEPDAEGNWSRVRNDVTGRWSPLRAVKLSRFNGKRTGYALHHRTDEEQTHAAK